MLTIDPINNQHIYQTNDGCSLVYDPASKVWTNGDMSNDTDWVIGDIDTRIIERAFEFDDCVAITSTLTVEEMQSARVAFLADQEAMTSTIKLIEIFTN